MRTRHDMVDADPMPDADDKLQSDLTAAFGALESRMLPSGKVFNIHSSGLAEDGLTYTLMINMVDGATIMISIAPGAPISVRVVA